MTKPHLGLSFELFANGTDRQFPVAVAVAWMYVTIKTNPKAGTTAIGTGIKRTAPVSHIARCTAIVVRKENGAVCITALITCYEETYLTIH